MNCNCTPSCNCKSNVIPPQVNESESMPLASYTNFCHNNGEGNNFNYYMKLIYENNTLNFTIKHLEKRLEKLEWDKDKNNKDFSINCETVEKLLLEEQEKSSKYASELDDLKSKLVSFY